MISLCFSVSVFEKFFSNFLFMLKYECHVVYLYVVCLSVSVRDFRRINASHQNYYFLPRSLVTLPIDTHFMAPLLQAASVLERLISLICMRYSNTHVTKFFRISSIFHVRIRCYRISRIFCMKRDGKNRGGKAR